MTTIISPTQRLADVDYYKIASFLTNNYGTLSVSVAYQWITKNVFHNNAANIYFYKKEFHYFYKKVKKQLLLLPAPLNKKEIHTLHPFLEKVWTELFKVQVMTAGKKRTKKYLRNKYRKTRKNKHPK